MINQGLICGLKIYLFFIIDSYWVELVYTYGKSGSIKTFIFKCEIILRGGIIFKM